jgi:hypothetical protein
MEKHSASIFWAEYGGSMFLQNYGTNLQVHMAITIQKRNINKSKIYFNYHSVFRLHAAKCNHERSHPIIKEWQLK